MFFEVCRLTMQTLSVLMFLGMLTFSSAQADSVVTRVDDAQVKKLVSTYEQFLAAVNKGNEQLTRRLLAGSTAGQIDNCIRDQWCRKNSGNNLIGVLKKCMENGAYPSLHGSIPWKFVEGRWNDRSARLAWQAEQVASSNRSIYFLAVHLILTDKGWKVFNANTVTRHMPIDHRNVNTIEYFLNDPKNQLVP
jgi:hypothetical protein